MGALSRGQEREVRVIVAEMLRERAKGKATPEPRPPAAPVPDAPPEPPAPEAPAKKSKKAK